MNDDLIDHAAERLERRVSATTPIRNDINVTFEFFPPSTNKGLATLTESARQLSAFNPEFVSVTYGAGGSGQDKTFDAIDELAQLDTVAIAGHLTCVAAARTTTQRVIDDYVDRGVTRIVALRGDAPEKSEGCAADGSHPDGYRSAAELVEGIRSRPDGATFDISVGAYPEVHPMARSSQADLDSLKAKLDAGANRALTQYFFDPDVFLRFLDRARRAGITAPIVPGIMPVTNFSAICRFSERCGADIPSWMRGLFEGLDDAPEIRELVAATVAAEHCKRLLEHGVRDFHFYTMNKPNLTAATCRILGVAPTPHPTEAAAKASQAS